MIGRRCDLAMHLPDEAAPVVIQWMLVIYSRGA